jgi:hypothetical protein
MWNARIAGVRKLKRLIEVALPGWCIAGVAFLGWQVAEGITKHEARMTNINYFDFIIFS